MRTLRTCAAATGAIALLAVSATGAIAQADPCIDWSSYPATLSGVIVDDELPEDPELAG